MNGLNIDFGCTNEAEQKKSASIVRDCSVTVLQSWFMGAGVIVVVRAQDSMSTSASRQCARKSIWPLVAHPYGSVD